MTWICAQEIAATWDAVGISTFSQASRMLLLGLNRGIEGNHFIEFETSVKALGLMPGDLITVSYPKENLNRTPFRVLKVSSGPAFRTAVISAQYHNDLWYTDEPTGIIGERMADRTGFGSAGSGGRHHARCLWESSKRTGIQGSERLREATARRMYSLTLPSRPLAGSWERCATPLVGLVPASW